MLEKEDISEVCVQIGCIENITVPEIVPMRSSQFLLNASSGGSWGLPLGRGEAGGPELAI